MRNLPETVHEYNIPRLNIWFIVSSFLLLLCVGWMLADDYFREWKPIQRQSKKFEIQKLTQDSAAAEKRMQEAGYADITKRRDEAAALIESHKSRHEELSAAFDKTRAALEIKKIKYAAEKAKLDEYKSTYDGTVELKKGAKAIAKALADLRHQEGVVADLDTVLVNLDAAKSAAQQELDTLDGAKKVAEKDLAKLSTEKNLIEKRLGQLRSKILPLVVDQPLVEFAAPTVSVKQVIAEDHKYSLNFVDVPRIDRCITCHTFAEKKDTLPDGEEGFRFANLPQPWKSHPRPDLFVDPNSPHPINRFGCSVCHLGWDRGTTFINSAHTPAFYPVKQDYAKMPLVEGKPYWVATASAEKWKPGLLGKVKEEQKLAADKRTLKASGHGDSARLQEVRAALEASRKGIQNQYGFNADDLAKFEFASMTQEEAWEKAPLKWEHAHHKEDPMRPREFNDSSCLKCHQGVTDIPTKPDPAGGSGLNPGEKLNAGLRLIEQAGCYACHKMRTLEASVMHKVKAGESLDSISHHFVAEPHAILAANGLANAAALKVGSELTIPVRVPYPKPGPSLLKIAGKTSKDWMRKWLADPKGFRPNTFMPQFWNVDNNRDGTHYEGLPTTPGRPPSSFDWADRNAVEMAGITEYLFNISEKPAYPAPPAGDVERGKKLVNSVGCLGCHVVDQKLADIAFKDQRYRSQGPMLLGSGSKYDAGWLYAWLKDPSQYRHDTRMPDLRLNDQEAADITAYLMGERNTEFDAQKLPEIKPDVLKDTALDYYYQKGMMSLEHAGKEVAGMSDEKKLLLIGDKAVQRYGCMNCHNVKGLENAKPISEELTEWATKRPGQLDFGFVEIPHNLYAFLHQKLDAPRSLDRVATKRPLEMLKMPQFNFSEAQIELIMTAVMGMTNEKPDGKARRVLTENEWYVENGRWLVKELNCLGCHVNEDGNGIQKGGAIRRTMDDEQPSLYPPSLAGVGTKVRPAWLHAFLKNPGSHVFRYWLPARMPTFNLSDDQLNTLTQYFAMREHQPYPYETDTTQDLPTPSRELIEAGAKIVSQAGCMTCHVVRTPEAAREAGNGAIDLADVRLRMRPKGIMAWLQDPQAVSPGVNMPGFWEKGKPSQLKDILDGDSQKQMEAVAAYLSVYGTPAAPAVKPPAPAPAPSPAPSPKAAK